VGIVPDALVDLVYTVNRAYRANGAFAMNSLTAAAIRKLKDTTGQYIWQQGLIAGQPDRLCGYPVAIWEDLSDIGANNFPVIFGDFQRGYQLVDRTDIRITRDPYTNPGYVRFYVRRRVGGHVWDNHALKVLQTL
jgi:HK97 family phage major capsid protein